VYIEHIHISLYIHFYIIYLFLMQEKCKRFTSILFGMIHSDTTVAVLLYKHKYCSVTVWDKPFVQFTRGIIYVILKPTASGVIQNDGDIIHKNTHKLSQTMECVFNVEDLFRSKYLWNTSKTKIQLNKNAFWKHKIQASIEEEFHSIKCKKKWMSLHRRQSWG